MVSRSRPVWPGFLILLAAGLLVVGTWRLARLRFTTGDVFPAYSSKRSDPLGTRVLYGALEATGVETRRNFTDWERTTWDRATVYLCGTSWKWLKALDVKESAGLLDAIENGSRLVVALFPEKPPVVSKETDAEPNDGDSVAPTKSDESEHSSDKEDSTKEETEPKAISPVSRWKLARARLPQSSAKLEWVASRDSTADPEGLPAELPWHAGTGMATEDESWRTVYSVEQVPVVLERAQGAGTIILVTDSFLLSNEAMLLARQPRFLAWLQGDSSIAIFDERHLGLRENVGVGTLARRYGLEHAAIVLAVVALLFVWRNRSVLAAVDVADEIQENANVVMGRDSASGFVNLLRRTLPVGEVFAASAAEFLSSRAARGMAAGLREELDRLRTSEAARDPVEASRRAHQILEKKHRI